MGEIRNSQKNYVKKFQGKRHRSKLLLRSTFEKQSLGDLEFWQITGSKAVFFNCCDELLGFVKATDV
jgi:hypothetical protein